MRRTLLLAIALLCSAVSVALANPPFVIVDVSSTNSGPGAVGGRQWSVLLANLPGGDTSITQPIDSFDQAKLAGPPATPATCSKDALATCAGTMTYFDGSAFLTGPLVFPASTGCPPGVSVHLAVAPAPVGFVSAPIATAILSPVDPTSQTPPFCVNVRFSMSQTEMLAQVPTGAMEGAMALQRAFNINLHDWAAASGAGSLFTNNPSSAVERTVSASVDGAAPTTATVTESVGGLTSILVAPYAHRVTYGSRLSLYASVYRAPGTSPGDSAWIQTYSDPISSRFLPSLFFTAVGNQTLTNAYGVVTLESEPLTKRTTLQVASALVTPTAVVGATVASGPIGPIEVVAANPTIRGLKVSARRGGRYNVTFSTTVAAGLTVTVRAARSSSLSKVSSGAPLTFTFRNLKIRKGAELVVIAGAQGVTPGSMRRALR